MALPTTGSFQLLSRLVARDGDGKFLCPLCRQAYPTIEAASVHHKHFHDIPAYPENDADACILDLLARTAGTEDPPAAQITASPVAASTDDRPIGKRGVKLAPKFPCSSCSQSYDTENALSLHHKWIHGEDGTGGPANCGYKLVYEFDGFKSASADHAETPGKSPIVPQLEGDPSQATEARKPRTRRCGTRDPRDPFWLDLRAPPAASKL